MNYKKTMEYVETLKSYGMVPGLNSIMELCKRLSNPQDTLKFVHIAGTNGKGSVLAYLSTILKCAGYKVGRYISPVMFHYCEKIQINGRSISQKALSECMEEIKDACEAMTLEGLPHPTLFEVETAAAFLYFKKKECDIVVLETGMGGREDATNLIKNTLVTVFTRISRDHMQFLGNDIREIAYQKAGIIKNGCFLISDRQEPEVFSVLGQEAEKKNCPVTVVNSAKKIKYGLECQKFSYVNTAGKRFLDLEISLTGKHQIENAALAVETIGKLTEIGFLVSEKQLRKGLLETSWQGRFEIVEKKPLFILDGAHNEDAAKKLAESIRFYFTNKRIVYIIGILKDKEYEKIIAETYAYADQIITVTPDNPRALPAIELAKVVQEYHPHVTAAGSLEEAVEMAYLLAKREDVIISFGSLSYLGHLTTILKKRQKNNAERKAGK